MARRRRPSLAQKAPLYPREGASRLMFGTPAARHPSLFNDFLSVTAKSKMRGLGEGRSPRCPKIPALCRSSGSFRRNKPTGFIPEQHQRDSAATTQRMEQASPPLLRPTPFKNETVFPRKEA